MRFIGNTIVAGEAIKAEIVIAKERISFWGGFDPLTGLIVDKTTQLYGENISNKILIIQSTRGSSGASNMLYISKLSGFAPTAIIIQDTESLAVLGCVAYKIPLVAHLTPDPFLTIKTGMIAELITKEHDKACLSIL